MPFYQKGDIRIRYEEVGADHVSGVGARLAEIAKAIGHKAERTETTLKRLQSNGQVLRNEEGRWAIVLTAPFNGNGII